MIRRTIPFQIPECNILKLFCAHAAHFLSWWFCTKKNLPCLSSISWPKSCQKPPHMLKWSTFSALKEPLSPFGPIQLTIQRSHVLPLRGGPCIASTRLNLTYCFCFSRKAWAAKGKEKVTLGISSKPFGPRGTCISSGQGPFNPTT